MTYGKDLYSDYVIKTSKNIDLNPNLMLAIISVESNWNPSAVRFEPTFQFHLNPSLYAHSLGITEMTEKMLQSFSWGLGQIMGATARELGMKGSLQSLSLPDCGSFWACVYMKKLSTKYPNLVDHISAYNAGSPIKRADGSYVNQDYVDKVIKLMA